MKKRLAVLLAGAILMMTTSAMATSVSVTYNAMNYAGLSGSFTGVDADNDGWLKLPELTNWSTIYYGGANFSALNDIGDFDYINNVWVPNALQWDQATQDAYMTWNNWSYSASTSNYDWAFQTTVDSDNTPVPEPGTMMLLGLGMAGLAIYSKRRAKA